MLTVPVEVRHQVAQELSQKPAGQLDPAAPLLVMHGSCPLCGQSAVSFRDELSVAEYKVSGLCQSCQDSVFGADGEAMEVSTDPVDFVELQEPVWNELD
jgi:hypothetical protein